MGASLGLTLRRTRPDWTVVGVDRDDLTCRKAVRRGAVETASPELAVLAGSELVVLAVPVLAMRALLPKVASAAPGATLTDLCSTKVDVLRWAVEASVALVGGHPLCGRTETGVDAARDDLYEGAPWVLTRPDPLVEEMVVAAGARPLILEPDEHDRLAAGVSHLAFLVSSAYMLAAAASPDWAAMGELAASGFRDVTRLAGGDPDMYVGIARTNAGNILARLDEFEAALARLRLHLEAGDARLAELFEEARDARRRWEASRSE